MGSAIHSLLGNSFIAQATQDQNRNRGHGHGQAIESVDALTIGQEQTE